MRACRLASPVKFPDFETLPNKAGIGLKPEHMRDLLSQDAPIGFLEVHAENYMGAGGAPHALLAILRERYPLSLHGVGLSIGAEGPLDSRHLDRLAGLIARYEPQSFSEHLAWSSHDDAYLNDLLPIAYTDQTLQRVADHIDEVQERLGCAMLLENPSTYVGFTASTWSEADFLKEVVRRTGCGLLLDVNNVQVTCTNHASDPIAYLDALPVEAVGEIHLAGYAVDADSLGAPLLIDAHGTPVADDVWTLFRHALQRTGPMPTLIEWDNDVPPLATLLQEAAKADAVLDAEARRRNSAAR
jgi:uncharacterized protein (UPF0276 family)